MLRLISLFRRWLLQSPVSEIREMVVVLRRESASVESQVATLEQLAACRAVLAATMKERDQYQDALWRACEELVDMRREREAERVAARFWITRTIAPQEVSEN